jgi:MSHA biogenesis protein MshK
MAESLMREKRRILVAGLMTCISSVTIMASAERLPDPTQPPAAFERPDQKSETAPSSAPVLQSVLIAPGRSVATVSGQEVRVGDRLGAAQVVNISETEVLLRNGNDVQTLKLFPDIEKQMSSRGFSAEAGRQRQ